MTPLYGEQIRGGRWRCARNILSEEKTVARTGPTAAKMERFVKMSDVSSPKITHRTCNLV